MKTAIVITTIRESTAAMRTLYLGMPADWEMHVAVDQKTPRPWRLDQAHIVEIERPALWGVNQYSRKNAGYLAAMRNGADWIVETDDDNSPYPEFFKKREVIWNALVAKSSTGWLNVYSLFTHQRVWPRGFPLERVLDSPAREYELLRLPVTCPVQVGLPDGDPDTDAVYRLTRREPVMFSRDKDPVCMSPYTWCPWNSQCTSWARNTFSLMYLPVHCDDRLSDLLRSYAVSRVLWSMNQNVAFHSPTVYQDRNPHDFLKDFAAEVNGYLNYSKIADALGRLQLDLGDTLENRLVRCYKELVSLGLCREQEIATLNTWLEEARDATR